MFGCRYVGDPNFVGLSDIELALSKLGEATVGLPHSREAPWRCQLFKIPDITLRRPAVLAVVSGVCAKHSRHIMLILRQAASKKL